MIYLKSSLPKGNLLDIIILLISISLIKIGFILIKFLAFNFSVMKFYIFLFIFIYGFNFCFLIIFLIYIFSTFFHLNQLFKGGFRLIYLLEVKVTDSKLIFKNILIFFLKSSFFKIKVSYNYNKAFFLIL